MGLVFSPALVQSSGIGVAAFLATVLTLFVFLSARKERLGISLVLILLASMLWAWFGFFYYLSASPWAARELRALSVVGIVCLNLAELHFAVAYLTERVPLRRVTQILVNIGYAGGAALLAVLASDLLLGTHLVVGIVSGSTQVVLAPRAGPLMGVLIGYYIAITVFSAILLVVRAHAGSDPLDRRRGQILFASMTLGFVFGGTRFTSWYGVPFYPVIGDLGYPIFVFAVLYAMQRYRLLNLQVAAAQVLVFALWSLTFFRVLLDPTLAAAIPDLALFAVVLLLGVFLLRSVVVEMRTQKKLARLTIDRAKSEFVSVAAHQLRTPLSAVRWVLSLLGADASLSPENRELVVKGNEAAKHMTDLVDDLLRAACAENSDAPYSFAEGDLREVVRSVSAAFAHEADQKKVTLLIELPAEAVPARFDRDRFTMAIENLLDNALKYTPSGGSVRVRLVQSTGSARIEVLDTGIGIRPEDQAHLFERFFRSEYARRMVTDGSGLGLYIAQSIAHAHGGTVRLVPNASGGTHATLTVPVPAQVSHTV